MSAIFNPAKKVRLVAFPTIERIKAELGRTDPGVRVAVAERWLSHATEWFRSEEADSETLADMPDIRTLTFRLSELSEFIAGLEAVAAACRDLCKGEGE